VNQFGLVAGLALIMFFAALAYRSYCIAKNAPDPFGSLLASIIGFKIVFTALLHIMVILGLIPFAGEGLPLVTTSGTQILVTMVEIGILMNISATKGKFRGDVELRENDLVDSSRIKKIIRALLP
jgi:cell division protein FtsW (lipid II flippase)